MKLRLGDHHIQTLAAANLATLQSAVALLRTVFEDHYVDPEHKSCLFFHGCTIVGGQNQCDDFSLIHRGDRVILSDFTLPWNGPAYISLPIRSYATEVVQFGEQVAEQTADLLTMPGLQQSFAEAYRMHLIALLALTHKFLADAADYENCCAEFQESHAFLKRPLEMAIKEVLAGSDPFQPYLVEARISFGPLKRGELLPMRLNQGDMIRVTVEDFANGGVQLTLEGVGSGGVRAGDSLYGMQLFYP